MGLVNVGAQTERDLPIWNGLICVHTPRNRLNGPGRNGGSKCMYWRTPSCLVLNASNDCVL